MLLEVIHQDLFKMETHVQEEELEVTIRRVGVEDHINIIKLFQVSRLGILMFNFTFYLWVYFCFLTHEN